MSLFKCRTVLPNQSQWHEREAFSPAEAANEFWFHTHDILQRVTWRLGNGERVYFARVEVEGHGTFVARIFCSGLWRSGGVALRNPPTLASIAEKLAWTGRPEELIEPNWEGEEQEQSL